MKSQLLTICTCVVTALMWSCGTQKTAQTTSGAQSGTEGRGESTTARILLPETRSETHAGATEPGAVVIGADGSTRPVMGFGSNFLNAAPEFTEMETQHVKFVWMSPRMGEMLVLTLPVLSRDFCPPVQGREILSEYGPRSGSMHTGVDIRTGQGDTIRSVMPGVVRMSKDYGNYGNMVVVRHPCGIETLYAHNSRNLVKVNDRVDKGQAIALGGRTGNASTEHIHFETLAAGQPFDPAIMMDYRAGTLKRDTIYIYNRGESLLVLNGESSKDLFAGKRLPAQSSAPAVNTTSASPSAVDPRPRTAAAATPDGAKVHVVVKGDVLSAIARNNGVTVDQLCLWNGIHRDGILEIGQRIIVGGGEDKPVPALPPRPVVSQTDITGNLVVAVQTAETSAGKTLETTAGRTAEVSAGRTAVKEGELPEVYTLQKGETLSGVARRFGVSLAVLCRLNGIDNPDKVDAGQALRLRDDAEPAPAAVTAEATPTPPATPTPAATPATPATPAGEMASNSTDVHIVKKGETLYKIAGNYSTTVARLCELNGIDENSILREGQQIKVK